MYFYANTVSNELTIIQITGGKPMDPTAINSVFELLYQICCTQDQFVTDRVTVVLNWLAEVAKISVQVKQCILF